MKTCINCAHRQLWGAGSRCKRDGKYIGYCETWDEVCRYWKESKRKPGEIEVYTEDVEMTEHEQEMEQCPHVWIYDHQSFDDVYLRCPRCGMVRLSAPGEIVARINRRQDTGRDQDG